MNTLVLRRKLIYLGAIVLLLIPLYFLGHPSVRTQSDRQGTETTLRQGGTLDQIRTKYGLHQSDLGELDPASESARLATLGLRGVAATILWQKAEQYKREKYYDRLSATVNQLRILQPHFIKVWEFQAHNLAWNVSVEFDDYRQRYEWVKKGIHFLIDGSKYNKTRTEMPFELGFAFGNKLGMSDERFQFRELYRNDRNFHNEVENRTGMDLTQVSAQGPDGKPDNWRSGVLWYNESYQMVERGSQMAKSPLMFYCKAPQWQYKHAEAIQLDGFLGEEARTAWRIAGTAWHEYGQRPIRTSFGTMIFLNELESAKNRLNEAIEEFKVAGGEYFSEFYERKLATLEPMEKEILNKEHAALTVEELRLLDIVKLKLKILPSELIRELPPEKQVAAAEIANEINRLNEQIDHVTRYRDQINYAYWEARCEAEQDDSALLARTSMYEADKLVDVGKLQEALKAYDTAWVHWNTLFNKFPAMIVDDAAEEVELTIERYKRYLDREDGLPDDFPLAKFLKFRQVYGEYMNDSVLMSQFAQWPKAHPGRNFIDDMLENYERFQPGSSETSPPGGATPSAQEKTADESLPANEQPSSEEAPSSEATQDSVADEPSSEPNAANAEEPSAEQPAATDVPAVKDPAVEEPVTEEPAAE